MGSLPDGFTSPNSTLAVASAASVSRIPRFDYGGHVREPRHQHRAARFQHHDRARVGGSNGRDEPRSRARQRKIRDVAAFPSSIATRKRSRTSAFFAAETATAMSSPFRVDDVRLWRGGLDRDERGIRIEHMAAQRHRRVRRRAASITGPPTGNSFARLWPMGMTCEEPPPDSTPMSACPPMTAMLRG